MGPRYEPVPGIGRFTTGTPNILGTVAVQEGTRLLAEAGIQALRAKGIALTELPDRAGRRLAGPARLRARVPAGSVPARVTRHACAIRRPGGSARRSSAPG